MFMPSRFSPSGRKTIYRREPLKGTLIGEIYRYLLVHRTKGTGVCNVQYLYDKYGSKKVHNYFRMLRRFYGFTIEPAGQPRNFIIKRKPNKYSELWQTLLGKDKTLNDPGDL